MVTPQLPLAPMPAKLAYTEWHPLSANQKSASRGGVTRRRDWQALVDFVQKEATRDVHYDKGRGGSWALAANKNGHRKVENTTEMSGLMLDSDSDGDPSQLFVALKAQGVAYLAYGSPSWTPTLAKYRLGIPLSKPLAVDTAEGVAKYKRALIALRRVCTKLAGYTTTSPDGIAFDPIPCSPATHYFLGHRRPGTDEFRPVWNNDGLALDVDALLALDAQLHPQPVAPNRSPGSAYTCKPSSGKAVALPEDFQIVKQDGCTIAFGCLPAKVGNVKCPQHGGDGTGTAFGFLLDGRPAIKCRKCDLTFYLRHQESLPTGASTDTYADLSGSHREPTEQDIDEALEEHHAALDTLAAYRLAPELAPTIAAAEAATYKYTPELHGLAKKLSKRTGGLAAGWRKDFVLAGLATDTKVRECPNPTAIPMLSLVTAKGAVVYRPCGRKNCYACGPELLAQEELALFEFPVTAPLKGDNETDGKRVPTGLPLASRDQLFLQLVPQGFLATARDSVRKSKLVDAHKGDAYLPVPLACGDWLVVSTVPLWSTARRAKWQEALDSDTTPEVAAMRARFSMPLAIPAKDALAIFRPLWRSAATPSTDIDGVDGKNIHIRQTRMEKSAGLTGQLGNILSDSRKGTVAVFRRNDGVQDEGVATKAKAVWKSHNIKVRETPAQEGQTKPQAITAARTSADILIQAFDLKVRKPKVKPQRKSKARGREELDDSPYLPWGE